MAYPECYTCPLFDKIDYQEGGSGCRAKECVYDAIFWKSGEDKGGEVNE